MRASLPGDHAPEPVEAGPVEAVAELADLWLKEGCTGKKASTLAMDRSRIERHVKPLLGLRAVSGPTVAEMEKFQLDVAAGKTAKAERTRPRGRARVTGGKGVAARSLSMLGSMLQFAVRRRIRPDNPVRGIKKFADERRRRFLSHEELRALGEVLRDAEEKGVALNAVHATWLLLLTGCRRMEVLALPWRWVDLKGRCIRFEDTKSGPQVRPVGSAPIHYLSRLPRMGEWVFSAASGKGHYVGLPRALATLCKRAGIDGISIHTLRHTFGAIAAETGFSELTIAGLLGHSVPGVTTRYSQMPDMALCAAADRVSTRIAAMLEGTADDHVVVPLRSAER